LLTASEEQTRAFACDAWSALYGLLTQRCTTSGLLADIQVESIEATFGVNRAIFRLSITNGILIGQTERAIRFYSSSSPSFTTTAGAFSSSTSSLPASSPSAGLTAALPDPALVRQWVQDMHAWRLSIVNASGEVMDSRTRLGSMAYWHACMMGYYRVIEKRGRGDAEVQVSAVAVLDGVVEAGEKVEFILWVSLSLRYVSQLKLGQSQ
jgi:hypothetical protein